MRLTILFGFLWPARAARASRILRETCRLVTLGFSWESAYNKASRYPFI